MTFLGTARRLTLTRTASSGAGAHRTVARRIARPAGGPSRPALPEAIMAMSKWKRPSIIRRRWRISRALAVRRLDGLPFGLMVAGSMVPGLGAACRLLLCPDFLMGWDPS